MDQESGLYYFRHRYYDFRIGRFINPEPQPVITQENLYTYAFNNPVNFVDRLGLCKFPPKAPSDVPPDPQDGIAETGIYIDVGYSGVIPPSFPVGTGMTFGTIVTPSGVYIYTGYGPMGGGAGWSATINYGTIPTSGTYTTISFHGKAAHVSMSMSKTGKSGAISGGIGPGGGGGAAITINRILPIWTW